MESQIIKFHGNESDLCRQCVNVKSYENPKYKLFRCWSYLCTYFIIGFVGDRGREDRGKFLLFYCVCNCVCVFLCLKFCKYLLCVICVCRRWWKWWHDGNGRHDLCIWITWRYWWRWFSPTLWQHWGYKGMYKKKHHVKSGDHFL